MWSCLNPSWSPSPPPLLGTQCHSYHTMRNCAFLLLEFMIILSLLQHGLLDLVGSRARDETLDSSSVEFGKEEERISPPSSTYKGSRNQIKDTTTVLFTLRRYMFSTKKDIILPPPTEPRLEHINITAVLISWTYPFDDVPAPIQFVVQRKKDSEQFKKVSDLLSATEYVHNNLTKIGGRYQFRVIAYHNGIASEPSSNSYLFINGETAPPGPPVNVKAQSLSYHEIELSWDPPEPFRTQLIYLVYCGTDLKDFEERTDPVYGETHMTLDTGLTPGTTYYFALRSDYGSHISILSCIVNATTDAEYLPPVKITAVVASVEWIWLSWSDPPPDHYPLSIDNFTVYYHTWEVDSNSGQNVTVGANNRNANVTCVRSATVYVFSVGYMAGGHQSKPSGSTTVTTLEGVSCYFCKPLSSTDLLVKWKTSSNVTRMRMIEILEAVGRQWLHIGAVNTTEPVGQYTISGLHPWSEHTFVVTLDSGLGPTVQSDQCPITECWTLEAKPSQPPSNISVTHTTSQEITLSWAPPPADAQNGIIRQYIIVFECTPRGYWQQCNTKRLEVPAVDQSATSYTISDLMPFTEYTLQLAAKNLAGESQLSFPHMETTLEEAPDGPPENISVYNITENTAALTWEPPMPWNQNGIISGYNVLYATLPNGKQDTYFTLNSEDAALEWVSTFGSDVANLSVSYTAVEIIGLSPETWYAVVVSAKTQGGVGPNSDMMKFSTLEAVIHQIIDVNFTAEVSTTNISCFAVVFSWFSPLPSDTAMVVQMNYSICYESQKNQSGAVRLDSNDTSFEFDYSESGLLPSELYMFWLAIDAKLSNGTREHLKSPPVNVTTPSCSDAGNGHHSRHHSHTGVIIITAVTSVCSTFAICVLLCVATCCIKRWIRKRREGIPNMLMDSCLSPEVEESEYMSLDLRRSDGRSNSSSSCSEEYSRSPSPVDSGSQPPSPSAADPENDSPDSATSERCPLLQGDFQDGSPLDTLMPRRNEQELIFIPRPVPEGCSETSSSSDSNLLVDI